VAGAAAAFFGTDLVPPSFRNIQGEGHMNIRKWAPALASLSLAIGSAFAATPRQLPADDPGVPVDASYWSFNGGEATLRFNTSFLELHGIGVDAPAGLLERRSHDAVSQPVSIRSSDGIRFAAARGSLDRFTGGMLHVEGRFSLTLPGGEQVAHNGFQVRVSPTNPLRFDVIGDDGRAWLYVDHLMFELVDDETRFHLRAADLRIGDELAARLRTPELAGAYIGELKFISDLRTRGPGDMGVIAGSGNPNFHGDPMPGGGTYQADVLMENYSMSYSRCRRSTGSGACDGTGPDDGEVVFTPSSTLRNSNNANTADIPWYEKFTGHTNPWGYPYPNADQHPYLIWNLYRIADDQLEQIAASGVKHAWLTTNTGCSAPFGGHILSRNCGDTYGTGNNDAPDDLGPRTEIVPAAGWFGRCGSIFDTDCNGSSNGVSSDGYRDRLIVRESQMLVPGAQYYSDSWYVVQDDVNIYNTMMYRSITPTPGAGGWSTGTQSSGIRGPLINAWVDPAANPTRNVEIDSDEGHTRIAVKVKTLDECPAGSGLSGTCYRYDYAVHNFDFARVQYGAPPNDEPPNLRVVDNRGFGSFTVPVPAADVYVPPAGHFADIDIDPANDWNATLGANTLTWTAPAGNELNWGTLYRFSFVTTTPADPAHVRPVRLGVAAGGAPAALQAMMMTPFVDGVPPVLHTVTATAGTGGSIAPPSQQVVDGGSASFTVTPSAGFQVASVTGNTCAPTGNGAGTWTAANITQDCAVTATFAANTYTVTASGNTGGAITPASQSVNHGGTATFNVSLQPGYRVVSVTGNTCAPTGNGAGTWTATNITGNCAVTATFALNAYTVTAAAGAGGGITPPTQQVNHGASATFNVTVQPGFNVVGVTGDTCTPTGNGAGTWTAANVTGNCAVTATFAQGSHTVTAIAGEGGTVDPASQSVPHGGTASVGVVPDDGYVLVSVSGDTCTPFRGSGTVWWASEIVEPCTITATFSQVIFVDGFEQSPAVGN
jgi:hypothetical protein